MVVVSRMSSILAVRRLSLCSYRNAQYFRDAVRSTITHRAQRVILSYSIQEHDEP